jgi:hypothetical protein
MRSAWFVIIMCYSEGQIKNNVMSWPCRAYGEQEWYLPGVGGGEQEGKRTLGSCSRRWKINFKVDLQGIGWEGLNLIGLPQDRVKW